MPAKELRIGDRTAYFRKAYTRPSFRTDRVLSADPFSFVELWLRRNCEEALPFWNQARYYYHASDKLPPQAAPLVLYYCFLNAAKTMLTVKGEDIREKHGVSGGFEAARRELKNENVKFQAVGITSSLCTHLGDETSPTEQSLKSLLLNLPYIHRAYTYTYTTQREIFIPVRNVVYRKHPTLRKVWVTFDIVGRYANSQTIRTLPDSFQLDVGDGSGNKIRTKKRVKWFTSSESDDQKSKALERLFNYHRSLRQRLVYIASSPDLWYVKRDLSNYTIINRSTITITLAAMHRLSELSRYDPGGLERYLSKKENFLLTEFIDRSPVQFLDEIACEITGLEFGVPGIRPR